MRRPTFLLIDLLLYVQIDAQNEDVGEDVESPDPQENLWIIKWYLFGQLHHSQDDDHVRSAEGYLSADMSGKLGVVVRDKAHICGLTAMFAIVVSRNWASGGEKVVTSCLLNV